MYYFCLFSAKFDNSKLNRRNYFKGLFLNLCIIVSGLSESGLSVKLFYGLDISSKFGLKLKIVFMGQLVGFFMGLSVFSHFRRVIS